MSIAAAAGQGLDCGVVDRHGGRPAQCGGAGGSGAWTTGSRERRFLLPPPMAAIFSR